MRSSILPVLLLLLLAGGAGYWSLTMDPGNTEVVEPENPGPDTGGTKPKPPPTDLKGDRKEVRNPTKEDRKVVNNSSDVIAHADAAQGVMGRVVGPSGVPVEGAEVFLIHGVGVDSFQLLMQYHQGKRFPPLAKTVTGRDGKFRIGFANFKDNKTLEIRVLHDNYCDHRVERLQLQPNDWIEKEIALKEGVTFFGTVRSETGGAIPDATVTCKPQNTSGLLSVPGRENGIQVQTDSTGYYELKNVDPLDLMSLSAHAINHTRQEKTELNPQENRVQVDFQLDTGFEIAGVVVDENNKPIRGAKVTALAMSQKAPQTEETYSNAQGEFIIVGLRESQFTLVAEATGFGRAEEKPIAAGDDQVSITMERLGTVFVTVLGKNNQPLSSYTANVKPVIAEDNYGKPLHTKEVRGAKGGRAEISGLNPMKYVVEVKHKNYAKNYSQQFELVAGQTQPVEVSVKLNQGGTFRGVVQDTKGKPIGGVEVITQPKGFVDNPLIQAFGGIPYTITRSVVKTDNKGRFSLSRLYPGEYQLTFKHASFCSIAVADNTAVMDQVTDVGIITLERGAEVTGVARIDGVPTSQVKVTVAAKVPEGSKQTNFFSAEAITDSEGKFLLPKRLPPGEYEARGAQMNAGPFQIMIQFQKVTPFRIGSGAEEHALIVNVPPLAK